MMSKARSIPLFRLSDSLHMGILVSCVCFIVHLKLTNSNNTQPRLYMSAFKSYGCPARIS